MAKAGRKRKANVSRTKSGAISRAGMALDRGTERAQAMQALYGIDGCDAIGRAYRAGLLGQGNEAKALLDTARAISNAYWTAYQVGGFQSPLADRTFGNVTAIDQAKVKRREEWLAHCLDCVRSMGADVRRAFDQLVIDVNPDHGPAWLDQAIFAKQHDKQTPDIARLKLRAALDALEALT